LGRTIAAKNTGESIQLTPFLDRLKGDSVYFENFFANGVQTSRGLFASFCSYYPSQGASAMKTRYANDYMCLPALLRNAGYRTEMIISQHRDINRLQLFIVRNGLELLFDVVEFTKVVDMIGSKVNVGRLY